LLADEGKEMQKRRVKEMRGHRRNSRDVEYCMGYGDALDKLEPLH